ncbi:calmodulin-regulated spectrin-associated protein 3 [Lampris incognitus]|uniref:calmodulin-regulated spectrin-associated protein 3 n=1 Tax=Lampris incognitus TaxID=2546036 RepID=UPI0024B4BDE0|nr:calmodulin-regulated spectrin-associated protein 3 [Lampris incognitus]
MEDASTMKKTFTVPEIKPLDQYDFNRAKTCASVRWLLAKSYGSAENVPVELRNPLYKDQYEQEHLKPDVSKLLLSSDHYCRAHALLAQAYGVSLPASQGSTSNNSALLQLLTKKGFTPKTQNEDVTEEDLSHDPIKMKAHLALIDALMSLAAQETVGRVKMALEAEQMGAGAPWENALLFWVNRLNQMLRQSTEEEEPSKSQTCTDLQPVQDTCSSNRWYWKLVPHAIAFCLKESGNKPPVIRYRKDKVQSKLTPTFPLVSGVKDLSNGCAIAAVLHYYCPSLLPLEDVCLKDTMSVADSLYNLQLIRDFCENSLHSCCPLAVEDLLYAPPALHVNIMSFVAELLEWFEVKKPDFVQPIQPLDLTDASGLLDCTSPVSGNSNSGSPSFIFKQPFVPISSPMSPENKTWAKKQIGRPLSAVTFSIPFGLDSDVDIVMGNPIDSVLRSVSTDSLTTGIPAMTSPLPSTGMTHVPYSPPEDLSHLVSASAPSQRSSWGPHTRSQTPPLGELPTIEEAHQVTHNPGAKDGRKGKPMDKGEKGGRRGVVVRPEPRLRPEGAPAGFFLHSPEDISAKFSSSAPCRTGMLYRPVGGEVAQKERQGRGEKRERSRHNSDMSRDDDSVLRDGSVDSSEASDDLPRNTAGNLRPGNGHQSSQSKGGSPRMTSFAERRDSRRRQSAAPGEESASAPTPTTPGTPHTPSTPAGMPGRQDSPGPRGPEPGPETWELGARLEEKRRSIEAQKKRIEAIFAKHRQRLGKTAFLQLKKEQGEGGVEGVGGDSLTLEERLTRMEEQLKKEEEKEAREKKEKENQGEKEKDRPTEGNIQPPPRLEKQVTFSVETQKGAEKGEREKEKGGEAVIVEYNEVVQKLSEALQSLQKDMQKLTEQQQQLMGKQRTVAKNMPKATPRSMPKSNIRTPPKTPPRTPTKTPPRTPTKTPMRSTSKAWVVPASPVPISSTTSPSQRSHVHSSSTNFNQSPISSSCPAPRTKIHSSSAPRSPKHLPRPTHQPHPRPSELKFPPLTRVLTPPQNVDTLPHLRRVSPSKCQVQTSSSFHIGGPRTPKGPPQGPPQTSQQPEESASETGSSETPTQFSLELEQEDGEAGVVMVASGAPSECSFDSDTLSLSVAYSAGGGGKCCSLIEPSLSSLRGPDAGSDEPTDEGQEFSSDSMSDHTEAAADPAGQMDAAAEPRQLSEQQTDAKEEKQTLWDKAAEPGGEPGDLGTRGGIGFIFMEEAHEGEMAQRKALLLERQQRRTEELRKRRQLNEQEKERRPASSEENRGSPSRTPPAGTTSPSPTPPATPARRGDFTRGEYARRQQLRIMADLDKVLRQKPASQGRGATKKSRPRPRPRSMTREESQLPQSPAKGSEGPKMTKVYSHSSLNLAAMPDEPRSSTSDATAKPQSRPRSPLRCMSPSRLTNQNGDKDWESGSNGTSPVPDYTGPKLFKEPSFKSNKFIIHNALSRCCLAGKVNETQKNKIIEEMEKSPANHFLILFRDSNCQFRGVYTMNPDSQELVRLAGVGPRTISSNQVESIYKYSSDRKQFSTIPSKTMGMSVDAFTIPSSLWQGAGGGGGGRRASITKKAGMSK